MPALAFDEVMGAGIFHDLCPGDELCMKLIFELRERLCDCIVSITSVNYNISTARRYHITDVEDTFQKRYLHSQPNSYLRCEGLVLNLGFS